MFNQPMPLQQYNHYNNAPQYDQNYANTPQYNQNYDNALQYNQNYDHPPHTTPFDDTL